jgi:hypothetical protein
MDIDVNGVKITLTKEQLQEIAIQTAKHKVEDIDGIKDAEKVLEGSGHTKYTESQFIREKDWLSYQLETIIKAVNFINNDNKIWTPDFTNSSIYKYLPWLERKSSGWVVYGVGGFRSFSGCPLWLYFKDKKSAELIVNKFLSLYSKVWG